MKVYSKVGSKERFVEMMQNVNKMKLNEAFMQDVETSVVGQVIDFLLSGQMDIRNTKTLVEGENTFIEISAVYGGNIVEFRFKVEGDEGEQDDVFHIKNATLIGVELNHGQEKYNENSEEVMDINDSRGSEFIDFLSDFVDFGDDTDSEDVFEEAMKLIDKIPYKKGSETLQTQKAYADQKPVNPKLRVDNPELQKFVKEETNDGIKLLEKKAITLAFEGLVQQMGRTPSLEEVRERANEIFMEWRLAKLNEDDYPDPIGKEFSGAANKYPKPKKKINKKVKIKEEDDAPEDGMDVHELGDEPEDIEVMMQAKDDAGDELEGGLADDKSAKEFDPEQIKLGLKVEMEHTDDPMVAIEIAMDHLMEDPEYYTRKDDPEASAQDGAAKDVEGDEEADELLGYKPKNVGQLPDSPEKDPEEKEEEDILLGYKPKNVGDYEGDDDINEYSDEMSYQEYKGKVGDRYRDNEGNEFAVSDITKGGVVLRGYGGSKEVSTGDLKFMEKLNEIDVVKTDDTKADNDKESSEINKGDEFTVTDSSEDEISLQKR